MGQSLRAAAERWWPFAVASAVLAAGFVATLSRVARLLGGRFVYGLDDAYIHLQVARNFAEHGSWGLNPGAFESPVSSLLWPGLLAAFHRLLGSAELVPLVLNVLLAFALLLVADRWLRSLGVGAGWRAGALVALAVATPLVPVALGGMEHVLQAVLGLGFLWLASSLPRQPSGRQLLCLAAVATLLALCRYEGLLLLVPAGATFLLQRRWRAAAAVAVAALPLLAFGCYSVAHGAYLLPNSVLIKAAILWLGSFGEHSWLWGAALAYPLLLALVVGVAASAALRIRLRGLAQPWPALDLATAWFVCAALLQWAGSRFTGQFHRYLLHLVAIGVALAAAHAWSWWSRPAHRLGRAAVALAVAIAVVASYGDVRAAVLGAANASWDIAAQQGQMAQLFSRYYAGQTVAVNDVGAVSYLGNVQVVDLVGLASSDITAMHLVRQRQAEVYGRVAAERGARVAAVYPGWFEGAIPVGWVKVGELQTLVDTTVVGGDTVVFYGTDAAAAEELRRNLVEFAPSVMVGTDLPVTP